MKRALIFLTLLTAMAVPLGCAPSAPTSSARISSRQIISSMRQASMRSSAAVRRLTSCISRR